MSTLYEIGGEIESILDRFFSEEITEAEMEAALAEYDAAEGDLADKIDAYVCLIRDVEAREAARMEEARRLANRAKVDAAKIERLKNRIAQVYERLGLKSLETQHGRVTLAMVGGKLPLVLRDSAPTPDQLPEEFVRVSRQYDKDAIRGALEAGSEISWAYLGERSRYVKIT